MRLSYVETQSVSRTSEGVQNYQKKSSEEQ